MPVRRPALLKAKNYLFRNVGRDTVPANKLETIPSFLPRAKRSSNDAQELYVVLLKLKDP
jgi:hypothetical protein